MSALDEIRTRDAAIDTPWWEPDYAERDRRTLLALYDTQALELNEAKLLSDEYRLTYLTIAGILGFSAPASHHQLCAEARATVAERDAQSLKLQAVREALEAIKAKCAAPALESDQREAVHFAYRTAEAALKQSRGAT